MRWCISPCHAAWSNIRAPPGARAMSARARSNSCCRSDMTSRSRRSCASSSRSSMKDRGDWPQWFMLEPYRQIRDRHSHGDVIVWPLKALCDYLECTNDLAFLDEPLAWRGDDFEPTAQAIRSRSMSNGCSRRCANGSFPARISFATAMATGTIRCSPPIPPCATGWSAAGRSRCSIQQIGRYARGAATRRPDGEADELGRTGGGDARRTSTATSSGRHRRRLCAVRAGAAASRNGCCTRATRAPALRYSLHPDDPQHHRRAVHAGTGAASSRAHPRTSAVPGRRAADGQAGGLSRRTSGEFPPAESASFFGREIGLMYVHAHLRYGEAMAVLGEAEAAREALMRLVNPISRHRASRQCVAAPAQRLFQQQRRRLPRPLPRRAPNGRGSRGHGRRRWRLAHLFQRPGSLHNVLVSLAFGIRRRFDERRVEPLLPRRLGPVTLEMVIDGRHDRWDLSAT